MTTGNDWREKAESLLRQGGMSYAEIARACGVNASQITRLRKRLEAEQRSGVDVPAGIPANERESYRKAALQALTIEQRVEHWTAMLESESEAVRMKALEKLDELAELVNVQEAPALVPIFALPKGAKLPFGAPPINEREK